MFGADIRTAVDVIAPRLVRIETIGGHEKVGEEFANEGICTGILLESDGYVMTSAFNFLHDPASILLRFADGTKKIAKKIATDKNRMLTLLKAEDMSTPQEMTLPIFRSKSSIRTGERCIAVGVALSLLEPNIALGIVSGKDRIWGKAIQTDAAVGPNNYGGPLIDTDGKMLGLLVPLSMMSNELTGGAEFYDAGVGLAIPMDDIIALLPKLKEGKDLEPGSLGIGFKDNQTFIGDAVIASIEPKSPAEKAEIKPGDKITAIDGKPINSALDIVKNLRLRYAGETLTIQLERQGKEQTITLTAVR
ncbi:hypothetical protein FACS1894189_3340 [Planctomycetales bacterium]|nr:hypothetical protein FACS1894189_3340 [Planctomycetales bacterium]